MLGSFLVCTQSMRDAFTVWRRHSLAEPTPTMIPGMLFVAWDFNPGTLRHNGRDSVSNYQRLDWLLNCLFWHKSNKTSKLRVTGLGEGNSPHKTPVTQKMSPFDDVILEHKLPPLFWWSDDLSYVVPVMIYCTINIRCSSVPKIPKNRTHLSSPARWCMGCFLFLKKN